MSRKVLTIESVGAHLAVRFFFDRHLELFGVKYAASQEALKIAGAQIKQLVRREGMAEVRLRIEVYFADPWPADHGGYSMFGFLKAHQRLATTNLARQLRSWFHLSAEQQAECESVLAFFCRRHEQRRKAPYLVSADLRMIALRGIGTVVIAIGATETRRRMAAFIDDDWTAKRGALKLSEFLKSHQDFATKGAIYARPATWESWVAQFGTGTYPSTVKLYPGSSTPLFLGVDADE